MDHDEFNERFYEFERINDLFALCIDGVYVWDLIRSKVKRNVGEYHKKQAEKPTISPVESTKKLVRGTVSNNPYVSTDVELLLWGQERRKQLDDGCWWDIHYDPIIEKLNRDYLLLEKPHNHRHYTPAKTDHIGYLDILCYSGDIRDVVGKRLVSISDTDQQRITELEKRFQDEFSTDYSLADTVLGALQKRQTLLPLYKLLLRRLDPSVVMLSKLVLPRKILIEACQYMDIPVVGLQYSIIHEYYPEVTYPNIAREFTTFPDYFFVWGEFWKDVVEMPIPDEHIVPVGFAHADKNRRTFADLSTQNKILFLSQAPVGERLSTIAVELSQKTSYDVVYKLHPVEYSDWRSRYPHLVNTSVDVIDGDDPPLYELLATAAVQVGVSSTAIYEGLNFETPTVLVAESNISAMDDLIGMDSVHLAQSAEEIHEIVDGLPNSSGVDSTIFFEPNAVNNIIRTINNIYH